MGLFKKNKEVVQPKKYLIPDAIVYTEYDMSPQEKIIYYISGFLVGSLVGYIFYSNVIIAIITGIIVGFVFVPIRQKQIISKQLKTLKIQFKDLLEAISTSIGAGRNVNDSFSGALIDLRDQYSEKSYIVKEVQGIINGINNNVNIEALLLDIAERSGVDDIKSFANVFEVCYRKGGNLKDVIKSTYQIINEKMEIDIEIETMVTSAKMEQSMMLAMPVIFVIILKTMGSSISGQGTSVSIISTTVALILFAIAYFIGKKILAIKL